MKIDHDIIMKNSYELSLLKNRLDIVIDSLFSTSVNAVFDVYNSDMRSLCITKNQLFISGGCIASYLQRKRINDYDVYFTSSSISDNVYNWLTVGTGKKYVEKIHPDYYGQKGVNAITLIDKYHNVPIQLIFRESGPPNDITKTFDFTHCTAFYYTGNLWISKLILHCIIHKILHVNNTNGVRVDRISKFLDRGYIRI